MLIEIRSDIFKEKIIKFHQGLNVVLGDNEGSNSIGKSTLLMIIDYIFGGNTYIEHNKDVVSNLGHHEFSYTFLFNKVSHYFIRGTEDPNIVYLSNKDYEKLESIKLSDYTQFLELHYDVNKDLSFRGLVSLFTRVWGKNNYDVKRPLHNHHSEKYEETIIRLIKLFNEFERLSIENKELKQLDELKKVINKAGSIKLIPKINKKKFEGNIKEIENLQIEIQKLGKSAYSPSINITEIISDELIKLREHKNKLIEERDYCRVRLNRTSRTITKATNVGLEKLSYFFPNVNMQKLENIEEFHNGINTILKMELAKAKKELTKKIEELTSEINEINQELEEVLNPNEEPNIFIDTLIEYSSRLKALQLENNYYKKLQTVTDDIALKNVSFDKIKEEIVERIKTTINNKIIEINDIVHKEKRTAPELDLTFKNYEYKLFENTGTGKAFTNLIIFDIVIFTLTSLPIIIHDSFLFKNIEKPTVESFIKLYDSTSRQVFISIDIIKNYNKETQKILKEKKVIQLSKNKLLTIRDWRDKPKDSKGFER
jgi:hypothetical protein